MTTQYLTITLTGRPPVRIRMLEWPIIARASDWDNENEYQANRTWKLLVRQHADGRTLVYAIHTTQYQGESNYRGGKLIEPGVDVPATIRRVGERMGQCDRLIDECIADLPAEDLSESAVQS